MKNLIALAFSISLSIVFGQENLHAIDTTTDYKERFFRKGQLNVQNTTLYMDSAYTYSMKYVQSNPTLDTTKLKRVQHGLWIEYYDKKWQICDRSDYAYYRLGEYDLGFTTGKIYYFNKKNELVKTALRYPKIQDTIFNGARKITYHKGNITQIEYQRFNEDSLKGFYFHSSFYYPNGQLKSYSLSDDYNHIYVSQEYTANGFCYSELGITPTESFQIKRKGRKEIIETKANGQLIKIIKVGGKEIKRKTL